MNGRPIISAYTPSNTDPKLLKRIFVQREKLLERIVDRLSRSMTKGDKHHILLVGPRGSGKTHLVSLAVWELQGKEELADVMRIAWLGEDDSFTGLVHLAFGIASQLAKEYPDEFPADFKTPVRRLSPDDAALAVLRSIIKQLGDRKLLLVTENMDQTFHSLGDSGQKKWRAFLQETRKIATLATAQQLFAGVSDRKEAFFGFFDIQHLEPLSVEEAAELIARISSEQSKPDLASYLNSAEGRFRIRALHYLAGGNHRMYVLLAEFLTKDSLEDLVAAFENLAHDMTPYFQERVRSLPDQQRQLVQCLCDAEGALTVKEIASETFIDERICSKQLGNLKAKGYVRSEKRGKESYYDMAEPLMRLCLEVKNQRGRPLRLVVRFLRAWFPATVLQSGSIARDAGRVGEYCAVALASGDAFETALAGKLISQIRGSIESGELAVAKKLAQELQYADALRARMLTGEIAFLEGDFGSSIESLTAIIEMADAPLDPKAMALFGRGDLNWRNKQFKESAADYEVVLSLPSISPKQRTKALFAVVEPMIDYCSLDEIKKALTRAFDEGDAQTVEYGGTPDDLLLMVLRRSPAEWAGYISEIVPLYVAYGVAEKLGQGVTKSIQHLDEGGFSESQIDTWNSAWQQAGVGYDDLELPLRCLDAAVEVMKAEPPTDRPLFRLPLEIRGLVRPLLKRSLGEAGEG